MHMLAYCDGFDIYFILFYFNYTSHLEWWARTGLDYTETRRPVSVSKMSTVYHETKLIIIITIFF